MNQNFPGKKEENLEHVMKSSMGKKRVFLGFWNQAILYSGLVPNEETKRFLKHLKKSSMEEINRTERDKS